MSVAVDGTAGSRFGKPELVFDGPYQADTTGHPSYDVSPDGERFLMVRLDGTAPTELNVILNVESELAQEVVPTNPSPAPGPRSRQGSTLGR